MSALSHARPIWLLDKLIGAHNELLDRTGRVGGGGIGIAIARLGSSIFPANTKYLDALVDDR